jgi:septal ring factor EnvC (AmiA/AmiB activator)
MRVMREDLRAKIAAEETSRMHVEAQMAPLQERRTEINRKISTFNRDLAILERDLRYFGG